MDKMQRRTDRGDGPNRIGGSSRSFAKDIAELALFLELTEPGDPLGQFDAAAMEVAAERKIPSTTLKRCVSEARALMEFARESGAILQIGARSDGSDWSLRQNLADWLDDVSLQAVLKQRALRLNRRRGGRPPSATRTLRAVEELVAFARAGRAGAMDELRSIRELIGEI